MSNHANSQSVNKTLVVYDQTDAVTRDLAAYVARELEADLVALNTLTPYPQVAALRSARLNWECRTGMYPALEEMPDLEAYGTVLVGSSAYRGGLAPAVARFLQDGDFSMRALGLFTSEDGTTEQHMSAQVKRLAGALSYVSTLIWPEVAPAQTLAAWCDGVRRLQSGRWAELCALLLGVEGARAA